MYVSIKILAAAMCTLLLGLSSVQAGEPQYIFINLGSGANELTISPPELTLKAGLTYQFVVSNPSESVHILAAPEFVVSTHTTELMKLSPRRHWPAAGLSQSTASLTTGISLLPGEILEWTFMPVKEGTYKFGCESPSHAAAGMHSMIRVVL